MNQAPSLLPQGIDQIGARNQGLLSLLNKNHPGNKSVDRRYWSALETMNKGGDVSKVHKLLLTASDAGDPYSTYALGTWYLDGFFVKKDVARATKLLRQAANANAASAAYDLAVCYEHGAGRIRKSIDKAAQYYLRAFLFGDLQAGASLERLLYWEVKSIGGRPLSQEFGRYLASIEK